MTSFENKDIRGSVIFRINITTRFFKALVYTVLGTVLGINIVPLSINAHASNAQRLWLSHACQYTVTSCQQPAIVPRPTSECELRWNCRKCGDCGLYNSIVIQCQIGTLKKV